MLAYQLVAIALLLVSAAFMYGPQLIVYGPKAFPALVANGQAQFVGGCLVSALVIVLLAPHLGSAFSSGGGAITLVMVDLFTLDYSLI